MSKKDDESYSKGFDDGAGIILVVVLGVCVALGIMYSLSCQSSVNDYVRCTAKSASYADLQFCQSYYGARL